MSVLIRGMKMPDRCWDCDLCYDKFYCKSLEICLLGEQDKKCRPKEFDPADDRLPNCPLVPVPQHGRLGDLDAALELAMQYCPDDDGTCSKAGADLRELLDEIESLPTIIPAEEGET